jgi:hypothetical protein
MDRGSIALEIWYLYSRIYERGDYALDRLIGAKAYERWLKVEMKDDHLDRISQFELELLRTELENAVGECCF